MGEKRGGDIRIFCIFALQIRISQFLKGDYITSAIQFPPDRTLKVMGRLFSFVVSTILCVPSCRMIFEYGHNVTVRGDCSCCKQTERASTFQRGILFFRPLFCRINNRPSVRQHILTNFSYDLKKLYKTTNKKLLKGLISF